MLIPLILCAAATAASGLALPLAIIGALTTTEPDPSDGRALAAVIILFLTAATATTYLAIHL